MPGDGHFGNRDEQAAVGNVVNRRHLPFRNKTANEVAIRLFLGEIHRWGRTVFTAMQFSQPERLAEMMTQRAVRALANEIGRASCRDRVCRTCRSRWSPYH